jgi:regulator of protease activity HflC (stomatin/prohibitin superfamily)
LLAAKSEAERLEIEGEGIRKYQQLIQAGLTDNFLRLKGIQATQTLAESSNSKIVVFGTPGTSGLPLVLGDIPTKK